MSRSGRCEPPGRPVWLAVQTDPGEIDSGRLPQGREGRRDQQLVFLPDRSHPGLRRPLATLSGFVPDARAIVGVLVDPDVYELVQGPELAGPAGGHRRDLLTACYGLVPLPYHRPDSSR